MSYKVLRRQGKVICYGPNADFYQPSLLEGDVLSVEETAPDIPVPQVMSVSRRQGRLALSQAGLLGPLETWINTQPEAFKIWYQDTSSFEKNNLMVLQAKQALGWTDEQLDGLFNLAAGL